MIRLGHIEYANCFPVHALFASGVVPDDIELVNGTPTELNSALAKGTIDVAPASSIEYARHSGTYRFLRDFVIGSKGAVGSILLESTRPMTELDDAAVALPTASATSVVLLKILLELRTGVRPRYHWFDQDVAIDPFAVGAVAALWIGDVALRRSVAADRHVYDLGAEWQQWIGLPFVFAAWQTSAPATRDADLRELARRLRESHAYFVSNAAELAETWSPHFNLAAPRLLAYWQSLCYTFDEPMQRGLLEYYRLAAQLGETPAVGYLSWLD